MNFRYFKLFYFYDPVLTSAIVEPLARLFGKR